MYMMHVKNLSVPHLFNMGADELSRPVVMLTMSSDGCLSPEFRSCLHSTRIVKEEARGRSFFPDAFESF